MENYFVNNYIKFNLSLLFIMESPPLTEEELNQIYNWVDEISLTRPKKNIARDFADGVLTAEIVAHYIPKIVEVHNYVPAHSTNQKLYNWNTLNRMT